MAHNCFRSWPHRARAHLFTLLGERCAWCGRDSELQFDCIVPQGHAHHAMGARSRMVFYRRQWRRQNLQLLCPDCHAVKGAFDRLYSIMQREGLVNPVLLSMVYNCESEVKNICNLLRENTLQKRNGCQ